MRFRFSLKTLALIVFSFITMVSCARQKAPANNHTTVLANYKHLVGKWINEAGDVIDVWQRYPDITPSIYWYTPVGIPELNAKKDDTLSFLVYDIMVGDIPGLNLYIQDPSDTSSFYKHKKIIITLGDENGYISPDENVLTVLIDSVEDNYKKILFKRLVTSIPFIQRRL